MRPEYRLRPRKVIERKMLCEALARLSAFAPLSKYRYVGFGALEFKDFVLFHQRLGVRSMIGIEKRDADRERYLFNKPHSCIRIRWGLASEVLPKLSWRLRQIVWLDYESHLSSEILSDVSIVASSLPSGSVLIVTVCADPLPLNPEAARMDEMRLQDLTARVGEEKVPSGFKGSELSLWGLARTYYSIVLREIAETLEARNAPQPSRSRIEFQQLFNFHYRDGTRMVTTGGLFLNPSDLLRLPNDHFSDLDFVMRDHEPYLIDVPRLTLRERFYLNERLPALAPDMCRPNWLPKKDRTTYGRVYRYFPFFTEAEL